MPASAPLHGLRVVDISRLLPGPFCSWYLAALGAEVVRVEREGGDYTRSMPPTRQGTGLFFASMMRGKRSVGLDLRDPRSHEAFFALLESADVLLEGFKPGTLARVGLSPESLRERFPGLVICSLTGHGQTGPLVDAPGHDLNYLALAGVVAADGRSEPYPVQVADLAGGALTAALSILAALYRKQLSGQGEWLDVSMVDGSLALLAPHLAVALGEERDLRPHGELLTGGFAAYRSYRCADDRWLSVGALEPKFQARAAQALGQPLPGDAQGWAELIATRPSEEWEALFEGCCIVAALDSRQLPEHPHHQARDNFQSVLGVPMPRAPFPWPQDCHVPALGEHTRAVLEPLGVDVDALIAAGLAQEPA